MRMRILHNFTFFVEKLNLIHWVICDCQRLHHNCAEIYYH